jgi:hypothetical protein
MRSILLAAAAAAIVAGGSASAFAQASAPSGWPFTYAPPRPLAPIESKPRHYYRSGPAYYGYRSAGYGYRGSHAGFGTCREYHYWRGGRCVDARTSPPNIR